MKLYKASSTALKRIAIFSFAGIVTAMAFSSCSFKPKDSSETKAAGNRVGQLRGFVAVDQAIRDRLLDPNSSGYFTVGSYIGHTSTQLEGIATILGGFTGVGPANKFRNGQPNAMNVLLWDRALTGFADQMAMRCLSQSVGVNFFSQAVLTNLDALCSWPSDNAKKSMDDFWDLAMGLNDFDEDREDWKEFFLSDTSPFKDAPPIETVQAMARAVFLNPFFLLETN